MKFSLGSLGKLGKIKSFSNLSDSFGGILKENGFVYHTTGKSKTLVVWCKKMKTNQI